jgi:CRP-like cAMP-binding protein
MGVGRIVRCKIGASANRKATSKMPPVPQKCRICSLFFRSGNFCAQLGGEELCDLNRNSRTLTLKRGDTLDSSMLRSWPILAVTDGVLSIKHILGDGRSSIAAFFLEGDIIDLRRRSNKMRGSLFALTEAKLCKLSTEVFEKIVATNPDAQRIAWENLREQINRAMDHSADLGKKQALEKLASFVFECRQWQSNDSLPGQTVGIPIRRCDVAEYLGLQPETVSRGFHELEARNIVKFQCPSIVEIISVPALKKIANGGQISDRFVRSNGVGAKILSFQ